MPFHAENAYGRILAVGYDFLNPVMIEFGEWIILKQFFEIEIGIPFFRDFKIAGDFNQKHGSFLFFLGFRN